MKIKYLLLLILGLSFTFIACGDDEEPEEMMEDCDTENITYSNSAGAIIDANCATSGCHSDSANAGGFSMEDYEKSVLAVGFGNVIKAINHEDGVSAMPAGADKLDDCTIAKLTAWVAAGTPE